MANGYLNGEQSVTFYRIHLHFRAIVRGNCPDISLYAPTRSQFSHGLILFVPLSLNRVEIEQRKLYTLKFH